MENNNTSDPNLANKIDFATDEKSINANNITPIVNASEILKYLFWMFICLGVQVVCIIWFIILAFSVPQLLLYIFIIWGVTYLIGIVWGLLYLRYHHKIVVSKFPKYDNIKYWLFAPIANVYLCWVIIILWAKIKNNEYLIERLYRKEMKELEKSKTETPSSSSTDLTTK